MDIVLKFKPLSRHGWYMAEPSPSLIMVEMTIDHNRQISKVMAGGKGMPVKTEFL